MSCEYLSEIGSYLKISTRSIRAAGPERILMCRCSRSSFSSASWRAAACASSAPVAVVHLKKSQLGMHWRLHTKRHTLLGVMLGESPNPGVCPPMLPGSKALPGAPPLPLYCKSEKLPLDKLSSALCRVCPLRLGGSKEKLLSVLALALLVRLVDMSPE